MSIDKYLAYELVELFKRIKQVDGIKSHDLFHINILEEQLNLIIDYHDKIDNSEGDDDGEIEDYWI